MVRAEGSAGANMAVSDANGVYTLKFRKVPTQSRASSRVSAKARLLRGCGNHKHDQLQQQLRSGRSDNHHG